MSGTERRLENRSNQSLRHTAVECSLVFNAHKTALEIVNYHYRGACFRVAKGDFSPLGIGCQLEFKIGLQEIKEKILYRVVWETIGEDGLFGVEFSTESSYALVRAERFIVHRINAPVISSQDPLDPNRIIYFKILNLSTNGMLLSTSMSNKHLFPGMELRTAILSIPGIGKADVNLFLENSRPGEDNTINFGASVKGSSPNYHSLISKYLSSLGSTADSEKRLERLDEAKFLQRNLREHLTIREITMPKDYDRVLKLRYDGYKKAGKVEGDKSWREMGEGLSQEGTILGAFLGAQLVASVELRFTSLGQKLRLEQVVSSNTLPALRNKEFMEINKLVVHPKVQNSDIVLGLFQKVHTMAMFNDKPDGLLVADDKLVTLYKRLGAKEIGFSYPHPTLAGARLHVMIIPRETYEGAKHINPYAWSQVYEQNHFFLQSIGMADTNTFKGLKRGTAKILGLALRIKKPKQKKKIQTDPKPPKQSGFVIDPKYTKQQINATVLLTYVLEASRLIGKPKVDQILLEFGLTPDYFKNLGNWISIEFFDEFIDKFAVHGDVHELNRAAGLRTVSREVLGPNYYIVKNLFSPKIVFKVFEKYLPKLNRTFSYEVLKLSSESATIRVTPLDRALSSKHPSVVDNWLAFTESYIRATTGKFVKTTLHKSIYQGDETTEFTVSWENPLFNKVYIAIAIAAVAILYNFVDVAAVLSGVTWAQGIAWSLGFVAAIAGIFAWKEHKQYAEIHDSFAEYERQSDEKYKELQTSNTTLENSYQEGKLLETVQREIQKSDDVSNILQISLNYLCTKFEFKRSFIVIKDEAASQFLRTAAVYGTENSIPEIWNFKVDVSRRRENPLVLSSVFHSGQSMLINNVGEHKYQLNEASKSLIEKLETNAFAMVPIPSEQSNWGVLVADKGKAGSLITRRDLVVLQRLCQSIGLALDKRSKIESEIRIRKIFQKFVPSAIIESTLGQKEFKLGGETKDAICFFMDIRNFTSLSEKIPPTILVDLLNKIFSILQLEVTRTGGIIDKYLGDGALVTWGAIPGSVADPKAAIVCAQSFLSALDRLNEEVVKSGLAPVQVGIGIHRGNVIAGNIGSNERAEFTVIGSAVNLASRLEQLTKTLNCHIIISDKVLNFSDLSSDWKTYEEIQVRGVNDKIRVATFAYFADQAKTPKSA